MPRGKYVNHKGRSRHFTAPEELEQESDENSEETGSGESNDESGATGGASGSKGAASSKSSVSSKQSQQKNRKAANVSSSEEDSDEDDDDDSDAEARGSKKGVASLIEIENPNRVIKKATQKVTHLSIEEKPNKPELTRREREQIEKQKARQRYEKLHAAGKTTEAKADLARLALIRQQREEAAAKREAEKKAADAKKPAGKA